MDGAMENSGQPALLTRLARQVDEQWDQVGEDRKNYLLGLRQLQQGKIAAAARVFRRAARQCEAPFSMMSRLALARCEVVRGHQGAALRLLDEVVTSQAPQALRHMAWRELADLARARGDKELAARAQRGIGQTGSDGA